MCSGGAAALNTKGKELPLDPENKTVAAYQGPLFNFRCRSQLRAGKLLTPGLGYARSTEFRLQKRDLSKYSNDEVETHAYLRLNMAPLRLLQLKICKSLLPASRATRPGTLRQTPCASRLSHCETCFEGGKVWGMLSRGMARGRCRLKTHMMTNLALNSEENNANHQFAV